MKKSIYYLLSAAALMLAFITIPVAIYIRDISLITGGFAAGFTGALFYALAENTKLKYKLNQYNRRKTY
jgi:hypothetical protein